jgi:hypothetical protein
MGLHARQSGISGTASKETYGLGVTRKSTRFASVAALREEAKVVYEALGAQRPTKDTLRKLGINPSFHLAAKLRLELTTSAFPYLRALT